MSTPSLLRAVVDNLLVISFGAFLVTWQISKRRIDAWALDEQRRKGQAKDYFQVIPPVDIVMKDWRLVARIRDVCGWTLIVCLLFVIGQSLWKVVA